MLKKSAILGSVSLLSFPVFATKLITLNIWGGHVGAPLSNFFSQYNEVDIFCIQEVYHNAKQKISDDDKVVNLNVFSELQSLLSNHKGFFTPVVNHEYGIGIFVRSGIDILNQGEILIHQNDNYPGLGPTHSRKLQWIKCKNKEKVFYVLNVHGLWNGKGKTDSSERIAQSLRINNFIKSLQDPVILCGDFNLRPDTKSIEIVEQGMNNLIKHYNIQSTRTDLYTKAEKFADYIFVSPKIKINTFEVLNNVVSDHSPLFLDFAI